ncbi:D-alanyl-D-alanine carboxypeptidase [Actinoplanes sp. NPDC051861]|uniref:D-alanyl-D-alanine carboxypeptidase family protein n=1 Tax=Actinoplanes sp. NPDC051861 TaxID=3155170 RepID=UPI00343A0FC5
MTQAPMPDGAGNNNAPQARGSAAVGAARVPAPAPAAGTVYGGGPTPTPKPRRTLLAVLIPTLVLAGLLGSGAAVQLTRDLPRPTLTSDITATLRIPGKPASMPWPGTGSAELMIEGLGRLGGSGSGPAQPIGSVAKVMTAYVILQNHPLDGDQEGPTLTVTADDVEDYEGRKVTGQSLVHVEEGEKLTERDALEALMLPSANNIAHQLAIWDAGSEDAFVDRMNAAADELGMANTEYSDPSGFLPTTISTAADQVILGRAALKLPAFAEIVELPDATIPVAGKINNYNDLLGENGVFGIKTGSTDQAGGCLLFAARLKVGAKTLIIIGAVFNQPGANTPEQLAAVNKVVRKLLTSVRKTVKEYELLPTAPAGRVETAWGETATISPATPLKVVGWPGLSVPVKVRTTAPAEGIAAGQEVGEVEASGVRVKLHTDTAAPEPSLWWRLTRLE